MTNVQASVSERLGRWGLPALLVAGFLVRLIFLGAEGFNNDVQTFEAWTISLVDHGIANFYGKTGFADYPPGYFYILALVGHLWQPFRPSDTSYTLLKILVKMPAVLADLGVGAIIYAIGRRFATVAVAFGAAALYVLNPATIFISAQWGQVDSIAGGLALLAIYLLLRSDDGRPTALSWPILGAWLVFSYSLLIKPQAAVLIPIMIAFAFTDRTRLRSRFASTAIGIAGAFFLALLIAAPFHPTFNPGELLHWLLQRYEIGSNVYPDNSVNAFNLWAIRGGFWQPDSNPIIGIPQYIWGLGLLVAALGLIVSRYVQERTPAALLESCAIALLAFFVLSTRMHERYVFDGVMFSIACLPIARRYLWSSLVLSVLLYANLTYSLQYLQVMTTPSPGVDPRNLWGPLTSFFALGVVGTFFALGYAFLGTAATVERETVARPVGSQPGSAPEAGSGLPTWRRARTWFDPREGLARMRAPLDYICMAALGLVSFVLSFVNYWYPADKVFDEIYFARGAEEYLQNLRIYENTHPPFSKLLVTLSVMLFGGMPKGHGLGGWTGLNALVGHMTSGDNAYGWRFLDVVFGALVVMLLYAFAKRVTGSTVFAALAALFLICDGMHFVQSRIATPEGFVVFFAVFASYAFYRFWIASQVEERAHVNVPEAAYAIGAGASIAAGLTVAVLWKLIWNPLDTAAFIVIALYAALGTYLFVRYVAFARLFADGKQQLTFAEGSQALVDAKGTTFYAADGGGFETNAAGKVVNVRRGAVSSNRGGDLAYQSGDLTIRYGKNAIVNYATPAGDATYVRNEIRTAGAVEQGRSATLWLLLFTVALGFLVSSKWYGVMGFGVSFIVLICVWLQRIVADRRPALWGNARGFRLDGALATIVFVAMTVYALAWAPDLIRHSADPNEIHNANDLVYRQYSMFEYHDTLQATHPYSSKWWEWPIDYVPIAYFYADHRKNQSDPHGCCLEEITSLPNPISMWLGLIAVPLVGFLAWRERRKAYALVVLTYLMQWLPWMRSPRITFAYHFYVDIPLICLCNAILLQRIYAWSCARGENGRLLGIASVAAVVLVVAGTFVFFYPVLAATPLSWDAWHARMWFGKWVVGPG
ncbi:MAG: phospholipid carrier-dependent glycosyltransferase [Candidatus Eremiobacteraeota bacterium]|nr:phospholipid carrier-dependent glycosyltransferase [Candidatus Eremiobacteraeota bacterium]